MASAPHFNALNETNRTDHWATLRELGGYLWPEGRPDLKARVVAALLALVLAKGINVYVPFLLKRAVDSLAGVTPGGSLSGPLGIPAIALGMILAYAGARVGSQVFGELRDFVFAKVSQHAQRVIALGTFRHLHSLSLAFHLDRQTGGLSRIIERGTRGIQTVLTFILFNIVPTIIEVILVAIILFFAFGWSMALVTIATIAAYIVFTLALTDWRVQFRKTMNQKDTEANTKAIDSLLNFETVKYFGNEEHEYRQFDRLLAGYEAAAVKSQTSLSMLNIGQGIIIAAGLVGVMAIAAQGVAGGTMTVGDFVLVNTYLIQLYLPLNFLGFVYRETKQSLVDMDKMFELLHVEQTIRDESGAQDLQSGPGEVEFDRVSFAYGNGREVLKDISFRVPAGRTVAIVGPSGAGKSTLSRLLFRFYEATSGAILVDGEDIRKVAQSSLRRAIGIVPQDTVLFNDTIGYNIRYGRPSASDEEVEKAARLAQVSGFIERLPAKYETLVGERGLKLSGGEKQRVAIARTILKSPRILVFDEATSALDSHTEREIQSSLREVSRDRTTLVIAHRLSTVVDADEILVLKDGRIAERGRHAELLAAGGEYASMWRRQAEARAAEEKLKEARS